MFTFDFFLLFVFISCSYCLLIRVLVARVLAPICSAPWSADGTEGEKSFCFSWVGCPEILLDGGGRIPVFFLAPCEGVQVLGVVFHFFRSLPFLYPVHCFGTLFYLYTVIFL